MRRASAVSGALLIGALTLATFTSTGHAKSLRQTAVVTFDHPTRVATSMLVGTYIIEHDDGRMAVGEPCTVFYRVLPGTRPMEEVVAFHCIPRERSATPNFSTRVVRDPITGVDTLEEYQFGGDSEGHGVPITALAEYRHASPCERTTSAQAADAHGASGPRYE